MPRIQEYLPEVGAAGPVGGVSPNLDQVTSVGRGIREFANETSQAVGHLLERSEQEEISEASANLSEIKSNFYGRITEDSQKGEIDVDKIKEDYQDQINELSDSYSTPRGKNYFNRTAARGLGTVLNKAVRSKIYLAGQKAVSDYKTWINSESNNIENDPTLLNDSIEGHAEQLNALVETGGLPASQRPKLERQGAQILAAAAIRGHAQTDPAEAMKLINDGEYDKIFDAKELDQQRAEVKKISRNNQVEQLRQIDIAKKLQTAQDTQWYDQNHEKIVSNGVSLRELEKAPISGAMKDHVRTIIEHNNKGGARIDPIKRNNFQDKILNGEVSTAPEIIKAAADKVIAAEDIPKFTRLLDSTPQGLVNKTNRKNLLDAAKKQLNYDSTGFLKDPKGPEKFASFSDALMEAEQEQIKNKKPIADLYRPDSKDYFLRNVDTFKNQDTLKSRAQFRINETAQNIKVPQIKRIEGQGLSPDMMREYLNQVRGAKK